MVEHDFDIDKLFEEGEAAALEAYVRLLRPADIAELFHFVEVDNWTKVTGYLDAERLGDLLAELDESQRELLGDALHPRVLVEAVDELETDDAADVIADLPDEKSVVVLEKIEDREEVEALLEYRDDSAGGIMQTELARVHEDAVVADAIEAVREIRDEVDDVLELYVVADGDRLCGTVALEDLVLSKSSRPIREIVEPVEAKVTPEVDQEEVAEIFGKYDLYTLPVVDAKGALLGRITFDDVQDVIEEEASEDIMAAVGASAEDLVYSGDFFRIAMFRAPWLITTLLGSMTAGFLMSKFRALPGDAILMASFVPVVMAMTGNIGSQSAMIVTRGLAIGKVELANIGRAFGREITVGLLIAVPAATTAGFIGYLWQGRAILGLVVGASMSASMSLAAFIGVAAPTVFKKLGIDPAIASGPLVTTICDLMGVGTYLLVALLLLT
jgi:magnesium transporter